MDAPTLTMVGHASVVLDLGPTVVWTDPWLRSRAFDDAWALHPEPTIDEHLLGRVTHIWISHEHPDHFNVPTLRSLPAAVRDSVTVLFQEHHRRDVREFLRANGFKVAEMAPGQPLAVPGGQLTCHPVGHEDSALVAESGPVTVLNLNDCKPTDRELRRIRRRYGPVDVLLDQFSGAGWNGNPDDLERKRRQGCVVRDTFARHLDVIEPRWIVPFASFVRFCHAESVHLERERVTLDDVVDAHGDRGLAVLYPGDSWSLETVWTGTDEARRRHAAEDERRASLPIVTSDPVSSDEVTAAATDMVERLRDAFHAPVRRLAPPVRFVVTDDGESQLHITISLRHGVLVDDATPAATDVHLGSHAAWNTFSMRWGLSTLLISGRFRVDGPEQPFLRLKQVGAAAAAGYRTRGVVALSRDRRFRAMMRRQVGHSLPGIRPPRS